MTLTIGSLFSGIGGLELGLERGIGDARTVWQVEQNEYCRGVLAKHWPDATRYEDVRHVGRDTLAPVDVICGGFPCQDISYAGKGAGLAGERSGLWYEYARIVRELGPRYVVVENVAALLTRGLGDVLGTLADLGYDAEWSRLSAADVGAPHKRERIFILAYSRIPAWHDAEADAQRANAYRIGSHRSREHLTRGAELRDEQNGHAQSVRRDVADTAQLLGNGSAHHARGGGEGSSAFSQSGDRDGAAGTGSGGWVSEPDVGRLAYGISAELVGPPLAALGNAVVPQVAEVVGRLIDEREAERRAA